MSKFLSYSRFKNFLRIFYRLKFTDYNSSKRHSFIIKCLAISINFPTQNIRLRKMMSEQNQEHNSVKLVYQNSYEVEKDITHLVVEAEKLIMKEKNSEAKILLQQALKIANDNQVYTNISAVYELLSALAYKEGGITEAEDMLADCIDKLLQLGYPEDHNSIIRFKLKLARLYQVVGNIDLAELGYRDCILAQEQKINKTRAVDDNTEIIYINSLFWYGKLLIEKKDLTKAKTFFKKCLNRIEFTNIIKPSQKMVVYYHNAEIAAALQDYDAALKYLYTAIDIGTLDDIGNPELPLYVVKVGIVFIQKGLYDNAEYWCKNALVLALDSTDAKKEAQMCLDKIKSLRKKPK